MKKQYFFEKKYLHENKHILINAGHNTTWPRMKIFILLSFIPLLILSSCLKSNLDELPAYEDAEILELRFEYRWYDTEVQHLRVFQMDAISTIDKVNSTISCVINVPPASSFFTAAIREDVKLSSLTGYCTISPAATIKPIGVSPQLGAVSDFSSSDIKYLVTAANGTTRTWSITISAFNKP